MTYSPNVNSLTPRRNIPKIEQYDVDRVLRRLISTSRNRQSTPINAVDRPQFAHVQTVPTGNQTRKLRDRTRIKWKHRSIGLLRRLALIVMVASILTAHYI